MSEPKFGSAEWFEGQAANVYCAMDEPEETTRSVMAHGADQVREAVAQALEWAADKGSLWVGRMGADTPEPVVHRDWLRKKAEEIRNVGS